MDPKKIFGKKVLIVDDEKDILDVLTELLGLCKLDTASTFEEAKDFLDRYDYDIVVLDITGVKGFDLLEIAKQKGIPALMLTAHALTEESLKRSAQEGAAYFVPKDKIEQIATFVADVIEARDKNKNPWVRWFERLGHHLRVAISNIRGSRRGCSRNTDSSEKGLSFSSSAYQ